MATITKRNGKWLAQIRRKGYEPRYRTFPSKKEARDWAEVIEGKLAAGELVDLGEARRTTLAEALTRYRDEVTPTKRGARQERQRIEGWLKDRCPPACWLA